MSGRLYITGRKKDLLIVGGRNFYPQDIEAICNTVAGAIPGRCVALGIDDASLGTQKVLVIVESDLEEPQALSRLGGDIRREVLEKLDCAIWQIRTVPHMWLLKTSSGKIARTPNLDKYQAEFGERAIPGAASTGSDERRASVVEVFA